VQPRKTYTLAVCLRRKRPPAVRGEKKGHPNANAPRAGWSKRSIALGQRLDKKRKYCTERNIGMKNVASVLPQRGADNVVPMSKKDGYGGSDARGGGRRKSGTFNSHPYS